MKDHMNIDRVGPDEGIGRDSVSDGLVDGISSGTNVSPQIVIGNGLLGSRVGFDGTLIGSGLDKSGIDSTVTLAGLSNAELTEPIPNLPDSVITHDHTVIETINYTWTPSLDDIKK